MVRHFPFIVVFLLVQWSLLNNVFGQETPLPTLNLSEIKGKNINELVVHRTLKQGSVPDSLDSITSMLSRLPEHSMASPLGDRYFSAFTLFNDTDEQNWFVYPYGSPVEKVEISQYTSGHRVKHVQNGIYAKGQIDFHYGEGIQLLPGESTSIVILFDSDVFVAPLKIVVKPESEAIDKFKLENIILLISLGVCLALGLYNFFLYLGTGSKPYLYYALSTMGFTLGWAYVFGVVNYFIPSASPAFASASFLLGLYFVAQFTSSFLVLDVHSKRLYKALRLVALLSLFSLILVFINIGLSILLVSVFSTLILVLSLTAGIKRWRANYLPARYFVIALLSVLIPNFVGNMINLNILPEMNINSFLLAQIGNSLDSLLLAFALAEKVRLTNLQNLALSNRLEQQVATRTIQLSSANEKLEEANLQLKEASKAKSQFLASMSHEVRTPLTAIIGFAESIQTGEIKKAQQSKAIQIIADNGHHLLDVINDILDLSKIEANKLEFESIPTPLLGMMKQLTEMMKKRATDKGLQFNIRLAFPLPDIIVSDPTRLKQILFNLINNALKFTDEGSVELSLEVNDKVLKISVADTGIGMDSTQIETLFMPFQQAEKSISRKYGGTGLGLSISKYLVEGLGGQIAVESEVNKGTRLTVTLPLVLHDSSVWLECDEKDDKNGFSKPVESMQHLADYNQARVLVVDDHPNILELVSLLLQKLRCQVVAVASGVEAKMQIQNQVDFDLVLLDIQMPTHDGIETLSMLRDAGCNAPVVALTANSMQHEVEQYTSLGFSSVISKPIERQQFVETLDYYLSTHSHLDDIVDAQDRLLLTRDYLGTLSADIMQFESLIDQGKIAEAQEISHRVKGTAITFGFDQIGTLFTDFDHAIKDRDESKSLSLAKNIHRLHQSIIQLPFLDLAQGIANHGFSMGRYVEHLGRWLTQQNNALQGVKSNLNKGDEQRFKVGLLQLKIEAETLALQGLFQHFDLLEEYMETLSFPPALCQKQIDLMEYKLDRIQKQFEIA